MATLAFRPPVRAARAAPSAARAAQSVTGVVVSTAATKTAVVEVYTYPPHPLYAKRIKKTKRYQAHDEVGVTVGDEVRLAPCPPMSKTKRFAVAEVVTKSKL